MKKSNLTILAIFAFAIIITGLNSVWILNQKEQAIVLQFGRPIREVKDAGLKFKTPFIQKVVKYDNRLLDLNPPAQEVVLNDKKRIEVDSFTRYKITNPLTFYKTVRTEYQAQTKLEDIINSSVRKVLGKTTLLNLLSSQRTQIMSDISDAVKKDASAIGIYVADVRIRRADLPVEVLQAINARMKAERERDAKEFRGQGQELSQNIKAKADKEKIIILAEAQKQAQMLRGQGEEEAIKIWNQAANKDKEFFSFYRSLEAYRKSLQDGKTNFVLSPNSEFFRYFNKTKAY